MHPTPHSEATRPLFATSVAARGATLLHAQCWLWGQDLHSPAGNLLHAAGLEPAAFEEARSHRSHYRGVLDGGQFVVAWSGGVLLGGREGSLFLPRMRFTPLELPGVWALAELPDLNGVTASAGSLSPAAARQLLSAAVAWTAAYEDGVEARAPSWRAECARRWAAIEEGARLVAASVDVQYEPLPPLPETGLAGEWRRFMADASL